MQAKTVFRVHQESQAFKEKSALEVKSDVIRKKLLTFMILPKRKLDKMREDR